MRGFYPSKTQVIQKSLETDSRSVALERSILLNRELEDHWETLKATKSSGQYDQFDSVVHQAKQLGFSYKPSHELAQAPITELLNRLHVLTKSDQSTDTVSAVMGGAPIPSTRLSEALEKYWTLSKADTMNQSDNQYRKWQNPRKKAIRNLIQVTGDIALTELTRDHMIHFRDWWIDRIHEENLANNTANKEIFFLGKILRTVAHHMKLEVDTLHLFHKIALPKGQKAERLPFDTQFIEQELLNPKNHDNLHVEARLFLFVMAGTGARPSELVGLRSEDIVLDHEIPHIRIRPYKGHTLKTKESQRDIPLVSVALWAMNQIPDGFSHYRSLKGGADSLSTLINKHLRANQLFPTNQHTCYSLRHSFQDRLTNDLTPARIECQLMGHKFEEKGRIKYGQGGTLETLHECLKRTQLNMRDHS